MQCCVLCAYPNSLIRYAMKSPCPKRRYLLRALQCSWNWYFSKNTSSTRLFTRSPIFLITCSSVHDSDDVDSDDESDDDEDVAAADSTTEREEGERTEEAREVGLFWCELAVESLNASTQSESPQHVLKKLIDLPINKICGTKKIHC